MKIIFLTIMPGMISFFAAAQSIRYPVTATYTELQAYNSSGDPFSFTTNQASLASVKNISAGIYSERRFLIADLAYYSTAFSFPSVGGGFGFSANYFGSRDYNESTISMAYGRKLNDKMDIGLQFNYFNVKAVTYPNASSLNFDLGMIFHISDQVRAGCHLYNPTESKIGKSQMERLPFIYSIGFGYTPSSNLYSGFELEKGEDQPVNLKDGLQYSFSKNMFARFGVTTLTSSYYFGLGFMVQEIRIDAVASIHPYLGITPGLLLTFNGH